MSNEDGNPSSTSVARYWISVAAEGKLSPSYLRKWLSMQPWFYRNWGFRQLHLFGIAREEVPVLECKLEFRRNCWQDLEHFEQTESWLTKEAFLAQARSRLDKGVDCYTLVEDGVLVFFGWLGRGVTGSRYTYVEQYVHFPPGSALIYNGYVHPKARGRGIHKQAQRLRIRDAFQSSETRYLFSGVEDRNKAAYRSAEGVGLLLQMTLTSRFRLGRVHCSRSVAPSAYPPLRELNDWPGDGLGERLPSAVLSSPSAPGAR